MAIVLAIGFAISTMGIAIASIISDARLQRRYSKYPSCIISNEFIDTVGGRS